MYRDKCPRCNEFYEDCACKDDFPVEEPITTRVVFNAACRLQKRALSLGIKAPRLTVGAKRPKHLERFISTGRIKLNRRPNRRGVVKPKATDYEA